VWCRILIVKHLVACVIGHLEIMLSLGQGLGNSVSSLVTLGFRFLVILHVHGGVSRDVAAVAEVRFCAFDFLDDLAEFFFGILVGWVLIFWVVFFVGCSEEFVLFAEGDAALP